MQYSENTTIQKRLIISIFVVGLVIAFNELLYTNLWINKIIVVVLVCLGCSNIFVIYHRHKLLITPLSLFSAIWLIIMPICSFEYPLMERMTQFQWRICLVACLMFFIGGLLSNSFAKKYFKDLSYHISEWKMSQLLYCVCLFILTFCIVLIFINVIIVGSFPAFSNDVNDARNTFYLPGFAFLCNIGIVAIYAVFCDSRFRKKKLFVCLSICYLVLQFLMAVRFIIIMLVIMLLSTFSINVKRKKQLFKIILFASVIILIFIGIMNFRGGRESKENYFIVSGIYSGDVNELLVTEPIRYFGMSQRTMESYMTRYEPGCTDMCLTLSPIFDLFGSEYPNPIRYGIYGYTATNIITNMYFDAGHFWWLLMIFWSFVMNVFYFNYKNRPNDIMRKYLWCIATISISMSFYCYINSYTYWCLHFVIILAFLKRISGRIIWNLK